MKKLLLLLAAGAAVSLGLHSREYPQCVHTDAGGLHFPAGREPMERFRSILRACAESPDSTATILHIGGSHVQAGWFSSRMRHHFDSISAAPASGRGFIFPYPLAHTNFDHSYNVSGEGDWIGSLSPNPNRKLPVRPNFGFTGLAAYTADTAAAFCLGTPVPFKRLHILGEASDGSVLPRVISGCDTLCCARDTLLSGFVAEFPSEVDTVRVEMGLGKGQCFTLTGLLPESERKCGISYISTGVNGARTTTWTERCPEFPREFGSIRPDLVIWGLGINDSACPEKDFKPERFKQNYRKLLDMVLEQSPSCAFIFITNNDSYRYSGRRMVHNGNGAAVRKAMFELAEEYDGAVWDLFSVMGGNGSANRWRDASLMKRDRLHFTREGYEMLGDMLFNAIMEDGE